MATIDHATALGMTVAAIQSNVIGPAMQSIGELWEFGRLEIAEERVATSICEGLLQHLSDRTPPAWHGPGVRENILLAAVQGQHHVLGLRMVGDVLETAGFDVLNLGANVPVTTLREVAATVRPAVVGLSFGLRSPAAPLAASLDAIHEVSPESRVMLGGRAIPPAFWIDRYPRVCNSMEVVEVVEDLLGARTGLHAGCNAERNASVRLASENGFWTTAMSGIEPGLNSDSV
jgi:methanogenic corrinoid protein MtbC1